MSIRTKNITSRARSLSFFIAVLLLSPSAAAHAAVTINEVMYNPQGADAGREWVELYNSGSEDVTIVGGSGSGSWRIVDSSNHTIVDPAGGVGRGSLTIPAGGYLILATDPAAFMGEYSGSYSVAKASLSLNNTGTTISLIDGAGATVDSVAYASGQGGNDNGTSLQISAGEWLQALPTPGAANATQAYIPPADVDDTSGSDTSSKSSSTSNPGYVAAPLPQVFADAGEDRAVVVGADAKFVATAYDRSRDVINYAKFFWNFGDGSSAEGPWVMHHYSYPGRYAVELTITNTSLRTTSRITVTAEPASVSLAALPLGGVSVQNESGRDLDVSFWIIKEGEQAFTLPEHSVVLKGSAINISAQTLGFAATAARLYYPNGTEVVFEAPAEELVASLADTPAEPAAAPSIVPAVYIEESASVVPEVFLSPEVSDVPVQTELAASVATAEPVLPLWTALAGLGGIMGLGIASVYAVRRRPVTTDSVEEFTIE
mgnify:CR=1 FL=1